MNNDSKKTNILHITDYLPNYYPIWGGAEKVAYRQIKTSLKLRDVKIFVGGTKPTQPLKEDFQFVRVCTTEDFMPPKFRHYVTSFKNQILPFDFVSFFHLIFIFKKIKPQIIHLHKVAKISLTPIIVAKIFKTPIILAIYDYWVFCPTRLLIDGGTNPCHKFHGPWCKNCSSLKGRSMLKMASFFRKRIFDFFFSKVTRFSVLSNACKDLIFKYLRDKKKIFVVKQLSIAQQNKGKIFVEKGSIFFNTWMLPHKGMHIVIQAFFNVVKSKPNTKLYVAVKDAGHYTDYKYYLKIKKMIKSLDLEEKIIFLGRLSHQEYLRRIKRAEIVVIAEQWENMAPTTLADSMSLGKPIVASKIGGMPEMIKDGKNGFLVDPQSPKDFAQKILKLLNNQSLVERMGSEAKKSIRGFGDEKIIINQLSNLYEDCR
ncbi:hypothetical protein B6D52_00730 [Candidatus Parcubacteria bacterium 4484_255]|nr:MAG: hypothetical protein B6D52_00730 [Candidatus Parcubacteria bacterium 4484_255]